MPATLSLEVKMSARAHAPTPSRRVLVNVHSPMDPGGFTVVGGIHPPRAPNEQAIKATAVDLLKNNPAYRRS